MKIILYFLLLTINFSLIQASPLRKLLALSSSTIAISSLFYSAHQWSQNRKNRNDLISQLNDTDTEVQQVIREHLKKHGYKNAETVPIKTYEPPYSEFEMESILDKCLILSTNYEIKIKDALSLSTQLCEEEKQLYFILFRF